jgi:hypothetical protein
MRRAAGTHLDQRHAASALHVDHRAATGNLRWPLLYSTEAYKYFYKNYRSMSRKIFVPVYASFLHIMYHLFMLCIIPSYYVIVNEVVRPENSKLFIDLTFLAFLLILDQRTSTSSDTPLWRCPSRKLGPIESLDIHATPAHLWPRRFCSFSGSMAMRFSAMAPVVSAVLAFLVSLFQSRRSLHLKILALEHQVAVYQRSVPQPRIQTTDRLLWA